MLVLGIEVSDQLLARWRAWLMPPVQPFLVPAEFASAIGADDDRQRLTPELRDTFELYSIAADEAVIWVDRRQAALLPEHFRHAQPARHRWPRRRAEDEALQAIRYIEDGRRPSRHGAVTETQWAAARTLLPRARVLAGTFPASSGPNCFGTVMAAAGVRGAASEWMQREPFETWLAASTEQGGGDDLGTVFVWRNAAGAAEHAAVGLGGGWLLHKPSQGWMSPTKVLAVRDGFSSARAAGRHLQRYVLR